MAASGVTRFAMPWAARDSGRDARRFPPPIPTARQGAQAFYAVVAPSLLDMVQGRCDRAVAFDNSRRLLQTMRT